MPTRTTSPLTSPPKPANRAARRRAEKLYLKLHRQKERLRLVEAGLLAPVNVSGPNRHERRHDAADKRRWERRGMRIARIRLTRQGVTLSRWRRLRQLVNAAIGRLKAA